MRERQLPMNFGAGQRHGRRGARSSWRTRLVPNAAGPRLVVSDASALSIKRTKCVLHALSSSVLLFEPQPLLLSNSLRPALSPCVALNTSGRRLSQRPPLDHPQSRKSTRQHHRRQPSTSVALALINQIDRVPAGSFRAYSDPEVQFQIST